MEDFIRIHEKLVESVGTDEDALDLYDELLEKAIQCSDVRARWSRMSREQKMDADEGRTRKHDSLIVKFNQLARYLDGTGRDISWREELGYTEDDPLCRKTIGDMGCYLAFIAAINMR